jgi:predicted ATPase/class 3 adenylate cyclase
METDRATTGAPAATARALTFLMTDIEGSTRAWDQAPEAMTKALARHDALVAEVVAGADGTLVKNRGEGDATFSVFAKPSDAVRAAIELQRRLAAEPWPDGMTLRVRAALHTGTADERDGDYFGQTVNRCARLRAIAHGGQTLLSSATERVARLALPAGAELDDLGLHRLKDLQHPEHVYQLNVEGMPTGFPPLRSLDAARHNLPMQLTSFVGRAADLAAVRARLRDARLVTLAGPGGIGKTRLALQTATEVYDDFADGVWFAPLAAATDDASVVQAVASATGVREAPGQRLSDAVNADLRAKRMLLVLDNCEHVIDAAARVSESILTSCPSVHIIATSRDPLAIAGENIWRVDPFTAPPLDADLEALEASDAVALFVDRVRSARPDFRIVDSNAAAVASICRRLDGIPLAIELAAAREPALTAAEIAARLDDRFALLTGGSRTAPPRHRTLRAAIDWGHELLTDAERTLFRRLSVFAPGFTLAQAEGVCAGDGLAATDVLDLLARLVDKSFVVVEVVDSQSRYRSLETVREYAAEALATAGETETLRDAHLAWFAAASASADETRGGQAQILDEIEAMYGNLHDALTWALERGRIDAALRLANRLAPYWGLRGYPSEGRRWLDRVLAQAEDADPALRARALRRAGELALQQGDHARARELLEQVLTHQGEPLIVAEAEGDLGHIALLTGDLATARDRYRSAIEHARAAGDERRLAHFLSGSANVARAGRDHQAARALYEESITLARATGDVAALAPKVFGLAGTLASLREYNAAETAYVECLALARQARNRRLQARALADLGQITSERGAHGEALPWLREALTIAKEMEDRGATAAALFYLGDTLLHLRELDEADEALEQSLQIWRGLGARHVVAEVLVSQGSLAHAREDATGARERFDEALTIALELDDGFLIALALESFAGVVSAEAAARLLGAADALSSPSAGRSPTQQTRYHHLHAALESALGSQIFAARYEEGRALDPYAAAAVARQP